MAEGALAELVGACTSGGVLTAWALYLELPPMLIGVLGALPFTAQLVHLPASWFTRRIGGRTVALWTIGLARQSVLPLAALPFLPLELRVKQGVFLVCASASAALAVAGNNAWTSWMGELVPSSVRGRYFGRRSALCAFAAVCASLPVGADAGCAGVGAGDVCCGAARAPACARKDNAVPLSAAKGKANTKSAAKNFRITLF